MSHNCSNEHSAGASGDHGHDHVHDHSDDLTPAQQKSLYEYISFDDIIAYNEATPGSGIAILRKPYTERLTTTPALLSDSEDPQLLLIIPFTCSVRLHSILIRAPPSTSHPKRIKLFLNRTDIDFSAASDTPAAQVLDVPMVPTGSDSEVLELPLKRSTWGNCHHVGVFVESNWGEDEDDSDEIVTNVSYLGFKGEFGYKREAPKGIVYEAQANIKDHKVRGAGNPMGSLGLGK